MFGIMIIFACTATQEDTALSDTASASSNTESTVAQVQWDNDTLKIIITGPRRNRTDQDESNDEGIGSEYRFGIVESLSASGGSCEEQSIYGCWTGEECGSDPYVAPSGQSITNKCHTVSSIVETSEDDIINITETFEYSLSIESYINQPSLASSVTAFPDPSTEKYEFRVSYYLEDVELSKCWAWGVDPAYFDDRNCYYPSRQQDVSETGTIRVLLD